MSAYSFQVYAVPASDRSEKMNESECKYLEIYVKSADTEALAEFVKETFDAQSEETAGESIVYKSGGCSITITPKTEETSEGVFSSIYCRGTIDRFSGDSDFALYANEKLGVDVLYSDLSVNPFTWHKASDGKVARVSIDFI